MISEYINEWQKRTSRMVMVANAMRTGMMVAATELGDARWVPEDITVDSLTLRQEDHSAEISWKTYGIDGRTKITIVVTSQDVALVEIDSAEEIPDVQMQLIDKGMILIEVIAGFRTGKEIKG